MGRWIAIDYGLKRVGLAVTDELRIIATALDTVPTSEAIAYLRKYFAQHTVDLIVMGQPKRSNGQDSEIQPSLNAFKAQLAAAFPHLPIEMEDERFTTKIAFQSMIESGVKKKDRREKGAVDRVSAVVILQSYMERTQK